jgi:hypothetical protein
VPNQLIQKPKRDDKNLCKTCSKVDVCEDYKVLKYTDVCDSYIRRDLCATCDMSNSCQFFGSHVLGVECADYGNKEGGSLPIFGTTIIMDDLENVCEKCYQRYNCDDTVKDHYKNGGCNKYDSHTEIYGEPQRRCPCCNGELVSVEKAGSQSFYICRKCGFTETFKRSLDNAMNSDKTNCKTCSNKDKCRVLSLIHPTDGGNCSWYNNADVFSGDKRLLCLDCERLKNQTCHRPFNKKLFNACSNYVGENKNGKQSVVKPIEVKISLSFENKLTKELSDSKFEKGSKVYNNLKSEYENTLRLFDGHASTSLIDVDKVKKIVNEVYDKSLKFLSLTLDIYKQLGVTSYDELKSENDELQGNLNTCRDTNSVLYKTLKEAVDRNNKMLVLMKKSKDRIDELFGQISLCKDAIMEIRLGLPELLNHQSTDELDKTITEGKDRISFGQRLLDEYKREGL